MEQSLLNPEFSHMNLEKCRKRVISYIIWSSSEIVIDELTVTKDFGCAENV